MSDFESDYGKNKPEPERFDANRASRMREEALDGFRRQMIRLERRLGVGLLMGLAIMAMGIVQLTRYQEVKGMLFAALLVLIGFETTVLLKLWFWIVNNKAGVLKEIKLLRIDLGQAGISPVEPEGVTLAYGFKTLPAWERWLWLLAIMLLAGIPFSYLAAQVEREHHRLQGRDGSGVMVSERAIMLDAAGHGTMVTTYTLMNNTGQPLKTFTVYSGGTIAKPYTIAPADSTISDGNGRKLAIQVNPAGVNHQNVVQLAEPVAPGEHFTLVWRESENASRKGGVWKFMMEQNWGYKENHYLDRVLLPPGAHYLSAWPEPARIEERNCRTELTLIKALGANGRWEYTIQYAMPEAGK